MNLDTHHHPCKPLSGFYRIFDLPSSTNDIWWDTCGSLLGLRSFTSSQCGTIMVDMTGHSISWAKSLSSSFRRRVVLSCGNTRLSSDCQGISDQPSMTTFMVFPVSVVLVTSCIVRASCLRRNPKKQFCGKKPRRSRDRIS